MFRTLSSAVLALVVLAATPAQASTQDFVGRATLTSPTGAKSKAPFGFRVKNGRLSGYLYANPNLKVSGTVKSNGKFRGTLAGTGTTGRLQGKLRYASLAGRGFLRNSGGTSSLTLASVKRPVTAPTPTNVDLNCNVQMNAYSQIVLKTYVKSVRVVANRDGAIYRWRVTFNNELFDNFYEDGTSPVSPDGTLTIRVKGNNFILAAVITIVYSGETDTSTGGVRAHVYRLVGDAFTVVLAPGHFETDLTYRY